VQSTGTGHGASRLPGVSDSAAGWGVVAVSLVFLAVGAFDVVALDASAVEALLASIPAAATLCVWIGVRRQGYDTSFYPRLFAWSLGGTLVLVGLVTFAILVQGGSVVPALPLVQFLGGVGAAGGLVAGINEVQSVAAARQAERARVEAELAERERERLQFLNNLLRHNVLNSVHIAQAYASLVREKSDADAELDTIQAQHDDVVDVVENVRVLVQSATGPPEREAVELGPLVAQEVESLEYATAPVAVEAAVPEGLAVEADALVRYVVENLLTNAVEHNDNETPHVEVTAERDGEWVHLRVADDGPGIPDGRKESVFEPTGAGNHGLGLYLVESLVSEYGGSVRVVDNEPRGAVFEVRLPAA
jgi:signal transduction histidine kinase